MKTLILSAGHYPEKTGASWKGLKEHLIAVQWTQAISDYLNKTHPTVLIETGSLTKKVEAVNRYVNMFPESVAVELHFNAAGEVYVEGNETLYCPGSVQGKVLAERYNAAFMEKAQKWVVKDRGVKEGWYRLDRPGIVDWYGDEDGDEMPDYWLRATKCPALILEPCFLCQIEEISGEWEECCYAIADALKTILQ